MSTRLDVGRGGIDGPIRAKVDVTVEAVTEAGSRLTITVDFDGHGIGSSSSPWSCAARKRRRCRRTSPR
jgi:hypothetical protein